MKTLTDDIEIFEMLSEAGMENFDPLKNSAFNFMFRESWCLLLFSPAGKYKGCRLYVLEMPTLEMDLREKLLPELISLPNDNGYFNLKNEALAIVEAFISNRKGEHLFFDAH